MPSPGGKAVASGNASAVEAAEASNEPNVSIANAADPNTNSDVVIANADSPAASAKAHSSKETKNNVNNKANSPVSKNADVKPHKSRNVNADSRHSPKSDTSPDTGAKDEE
jgi:hypothetical protein